ncbi:zinc finger imprinted 3-like [Bolinopsis microptera]|uniref:zinc finger imprinted 3-like n=1 Tax=Bolinopsis microptera TaxID=2820187 RepID=UPI00307AD39E
MAASSYFIGLDLSDSGLQDESRNQDLELEDTNNNNGIAKEVEVETSLPVVQVGKKTVCPVCDKRYSCPANLRKHVRKVHKPNSGHIQLKYCPVCGKGDREQHRLNAHIKEVHQNNFVECNLCNKKYKQRRNLWHHMKTAHKE